MVARADREISKDVLLHAIMRNTIAPVLLNAGFRGNVIPSSAQATINFRVIPGTTSGGSDRRNQKVDRGSECRRHLARTRRATFGNESPTTTDLYRALAESAGQLWPGVPVTPYLFQAGTDAGAWRSRGVPVYGIYPYPISNDDLSRMHGNDERVPIDSLEQGTDLIYRTLLRVAARQ